MALISASAFSTVIPSLNLATARSQWLPRWASGLKRSGCQTWGWLVRTPSGGIHAYYPAAPGPEQRSWQVPGAHIDFRGDGGYVIAPPSRLMVGGVGKSYDVIAVTTGRPATVDAIKLRQFLERGVFIDAQVFGGRRLHFLFERGLDRFGFRRRRRQCIAERHRGLLGRPAIPDVAGGIAQLLQHVGAQLVVDGLQCVDRLDDRLYGRRGDGAGFGNVRQQDLLRQSGNRSQ